METWELWCFRSGNLLDWTDSQTQANEWIADLEADENGTDFGVLVLDSTGTIIRSLWPPEAE